MHGVLRKRRRNNTVAQSESHSRCCVSVEFASTSITVQVVVGGWERP